MAPANKTILRALCVGALVAMTTPAMAQGSSEDITVTGRYGRVPDSAQTASMAVSYADLDLSLQRDRAILKRRISLTARYVCDKLGESDTQAVGPSCRDAATSDALSRVGTLEEGFSPRGTAWVAPSPWHAPYSDDWAARYP
jgi:UrcA family protein